ncbi:molybdopterin-guanine dinucleotide biosynthesis protein B [Fictibacillus iocasae]|uniref:Molybdopterin-guanine dinucleotide biosynthesis protein B n=1 Tax=Fictibacillus iocasae TaxID=2715437 RepID=A0ABW2NP65_9BACL
MGLTKPVLQLAGYSNSGKTKLMERLIVEASKNGWRTGTLKHHGHGGVPDMSDGGKDSGKHRQAGAAVTGVEGGGMFLLSAEKQQWTLEELLSFYEAMDMDLILVEGYKHADLPKIAIIKEPDDLSLLQSLTNVQAVASWKPLTHDLDVPIFLMEDDALMDWFRNYIKGVMR